ncbi:zinc finger E-box-binding homeobox 1 [Aplochiton taeniatus]
MLQQGDTAIIYPEAPEDEHSIAETGVPDENGTPDTFSKLHTCPYCSRGYKRNASLKEHIKYRHEKSEDNFSCSQCSYTFAFRTQLERHMTQHKSTREQRHVTPSGGNRKFKCTECSKAFKYKHHLKEHLRIHSGEKPYECSNCKKRFSHSGSYSSHISSKKCVGMVPPNGVPRLLIKPAPQPAGAAVTPGRILLKDKTEGKPLQEQVPVTQIKAEPVEYECKPVAVAPAAGTNGVLNGSVAQPAAPVVAATQGVVQAMVLPTMGLMSPISINLSDLQSVLKVAMDGNVLRQVLGTANGVVTQGKQGIVVQQPQQQIISLPAFVDQDGTTKIIINYSLNSSLSTALAQAVPAPLALKKDPPPPSTTTTTTILSPTKTPQPSAPAEEKVATDLRLVKAEPQTDPEASAEAEVEADAGAVEAVPLEAVAQAPKSTSSCLLCDDCPEGLEALHLLQHRKAANGEAVDSAALDPSFAALLMDAGVTLDDPPVDDLLSLLKAYFASNADPQEEELAKISESVSIPVEVVRKWFHKMRSGQITVGPPSGSSSGSDPPLADRLTAETAATPKQNGDLEEPPTEASQGISPHPPTETTPVSLSPLNLTSNNPIIVKTEEEGPEAETQAEPLDLSLPKQAPKEGSDTTHIPKQQEHPLNLTCLRKEQLQGRTIYVTTSTSSPQAGGIMTATQLPTLVAIANQGALPCLTAINTTTKRTILIPQLTYTYTTTAGNTAGAKTVVLNGCQQETKQDSSSEGVSTVDEQNESDAASPAKKRRLESGVYPCDLCDKVFQKGSSLLRHKYEHTGKRPHECHICKKAFKHKHHLIEHSRLHSGEKPYQCDKCGKRFSHSGSYSQHMNHRYSYCKKDGPGSGPHRGLPGPREGLQPGSVEGSLSPDTGPQSDSRTTSPPSQLDSDERESEEEEDEEDEEEGMAFSMDDIRVVQVDEDGECEIYEGGEFEEDGGGNEEDGGEEKEGTRESDEVPKEVVCEGDGVEVKLISGPVLETEMEKEILENKEIVEATGGAIKMEDNDMQADVADEVSDNGQTNKDML